MGMEQHLDKHSENWNKAISPHYFDVKTHKNTP